MGTELAKFYRAVDNPIGDEFASMPVLIKFGVMSELLHILSEEFFEMSLLEIRNILIKRLVYRLVCRKIDNAEDLEGHSARYFQNRVFYDALKTLIQNPAGNGAETNNYPAMAGRNGGKRAEDETGNEYNSSDNDTRPACETGSGVTPGIFARLVGIDTQPEN